MYDDQLIERTQESQPPRSYLGTVNNTATAYSDDVYVVIPSIDDGDHKWGPCRWSLRGADYPKKGDLALVSFDETGVPWITEWVPTIPTPVGGGGGTVVDASDTVKGINKMSVAPAVATNPIAVGDNDARVANVEHTTNKGVASGYAPLDSGLLVPVANLPGATLTAKGVVQLAGDLAGTSAAPVIAPLAVTDAKVAAANKDGTVATPSMRTLGTGAAQAAAGNDARFTDARTPTAHHTTHEPGGSDAMAVDAVAATGSLRTLGAGAQQAVSGTDARLSNSRTPTAHASTHQPGGSDAMAVDAAAATGSLRTLGSGALQAASGTDARLSDTRTPTALSVVDASVSATAAIAESKLNLATDAAVGTGSRRTLGSGALQAMPGNRTLDAIPLAAADVSINTHKLTSVVDPTAAQDAATKNYVDNRSTPNMDDLQNGVINATDCALTINSSTQVTIAAGVVWVKNASGLLLRTTPVSTALSGIAAASASNFRLDQVVISSVGVISLLTGTQGTTVTLANRTGAAAIPSGSMLLHDVLVSSSGVVAGNARDRRPWARGAFLTGFRTAGNYTISVTSLAAVDTTNLRFRIECTGVPIHLKIHAFGGRSVASTRWDVGFMMDGAGLSSLGAPNARFFSVDNSNANAYTVVQTITPSAGSHLFDIGASVGDAAGGTYTLYGSSVSPLHWSIEENIRQNSSNGTS